MDQNWAKTRHLLFKTWKSSISMDSPIVQCCAQAQCRRLSGKLLTTVLLSLTHYTLLNSKCCPAATSSDCHGLRFNIVWNIKMFTRVHKFQWYQSWHHRQVRTSIRTIIVTWQFRVTLDSIFNSCDVCSWGHVSSSLWSNISKAINLPTTYLQNKNTNTKIKTKTNTLIY